MKKNKLAKNQYYLFMIFDILTTLKYPSILIDLPVKALKKSFAFDGRSFKNRPLAIFNLV